MRRWGIELSAARSRESSLWRTVRQTKACFGSEITRRLAHARRRGAFKPRKRRLLHPFPRPRKRMGLPRPERYTILDRLKIWTKTVNRNKGISKWPYTKCRYCTSSTASGPPSPQGEGFGLMQKIYLENRRRRVMVCNTWNKFHKLSKRQFKKKL